MKDEVAGVAVKKSVRLKPKMYSFLTDDSNYHKKANQNVVAAISHNDFKDVLSNQKYFRHSVNRIQSTNHRVETNEINKTPLPCFDDKIRILNNEYAVAYMCSWKNSI